MPIDNSAFIDPSAGRQDSFTLAITHKEESGKIVLDCIREARPPFQPQNVAEEFAEVLKAFDVGQIGSDKFAGEWVVAEFAKHGIYVEGSELSSSEIYLNFLPLMMNGTIELLENRRLIEQLRGLERRARVGGRDLVSHPQFTDAHDDLAVAVAGASLRASRHTIIFSPEALVEMMSPMPELSREDKFDRYVTNWLLDRPQEPWKAEDDLDE